MTAEFLTFDTSFGPFSVAVNAAGAVVATAFGDREALAVRAPHCRLISNTQRASEVRQQLLEYFAGERRTFDLPLAPQGSPFQQRIWRALEQIPYGQTRTYGELARELGSSARAVGRANATNPICVIVPCHRVVGAAGALTGFAFGVPLKQRLLELERRGEASSPLSRGELALTA